MDGSTWEPLLEQETSFRGGKTQERRLTDAYDNSLTRNYLNIINKLLAKPIMITLDMKASDCTSKVRMSHSSIKMDC